MIPDKERLRKALHHIFEMDALDGETYVRIGGLDDNDVTIDGNYNLNELAQRIIEELQK